MAVAGNDMAVQAAYDHLMQQNRHASWTNLPSPQCVRRSTSVGINRLGFKRPRRESSIMPTGMRSGSASSVAHTRAKTPPISSARCPKKPNHQRFPQAPWASNMCHRLSKELSEALGQGSFTSRCLRLGTDCAGAEAPVFALREISREVSRLLGVQLHVDHLFACDVDFASREFIARNCMPTALFCDLLARDMMSHCLRAEMPRVVPSDLDIYVAGFPCKDFSMLNSNRPCLNGPHATIFHGVVRYITLHQPRTYVLENVWGLTLSQRGQEAPIHEIMRRLRAIPDYQVRGWKVNTLDYYLPQNRKRVYIVGVNTRKASLRRPLETWSPLLRSLEKRTKAMAHDYLLDDEEPEVRAEYERLLGKQPLAPAPAAPLLDRPDYDVAAGPAFKFRRYGLGWVKRHRLVRAQMGLRSNVQVVKDVERSWARFLSTRTRDLLDLSGAKVFRQTGGRPEDSDFVSEVSRGVGFANCMDKVSPCVTPACRLWIFNRWRWLIGKEKMALQGFPVDSLDLGGLSESEINILAGNAMSVPVVGAILFLVLALVRFPAESAATLGVPGPPPRPQPKPPPQPPPHPPVHPPPQPLPQPPLQPPPPPLPRKRRPAL